MNKVIMYGRLTKDPEIRYTPSRNGEDMAVARFTIAVDRKFKSKNDEVTADFFDCTAFGAQAKFLEKYFAKGSRVLVAGRLQNNNYTNKNGEKVYSYQIMVEDVEFGDSKKEAPKQEDDFVSVPEGIEGDLPFK